MTAPTLNASRKTKKTAVGEIPVDWAVRTVGQIATFSNGHGFTPKDWTKSGLPIIRIQNLNGSREFNYFMGKPEPDWIVLPGELLFAWAGVRGVSFGPTIWPGPRGVLNQHIYKIHPSSDVDQAWLFSALLDVTHRIETKAHGFKSSLVHVHKSEIVGAKLRVPPLAEQRRIAAVLGTWDRAIERQEQLLAAKQQFKQSLMQQLLTGKKRFPEFKGQKWQKVQLGEVFERVVRRVTPDVEHVLSITARVGFVTQQSKFSKIIAGNTLERYILLRRGEFAYNKGNSKSYKQGCIYKLDSYDEAAVPQVYICFGAKTRDVDSEFYRYYFEAGLLNSQLMGIINAGVRNDGLLNMDPDNFFKLRIHVPPVAEQKKIAGVFQTVDRELALLQRKAAELRDQKKGLMQQLLTGKLRVKG